jgi:hypothetical protein
MLFLKKNLSIWFLATWFAILQSISPFVHAHINSSNHADINNGLHIHTINLDAVSKVKKNVTINDYALDTHIVDLDKGVIKKLEPLVQACAIIAIFIFFILQTSKPKIRPPQPVKAKSSYQRTSLNPRAPPYF